MIEMFCDKTMFDATRSKVLVPDFGGRFFPIFGQDKDDFLATTVIILFNEKVRIISTYVYVLKYS